MNYDIAHESQNFETYWNLYGHCCGNFGVTDYAKSRYVDNPCITSENKFLTMTKFRFWWSSQQRHLLVSLPRLAEFLTVIIFIYLWCACHNFVCIIYPVSIKILAVDARVNNFHLKSLHVGGENNTEICMIDHACFHIPHWKPFYERDDYSYFNSSISEVHKNNVKNNGAKYRIIIMYLGNKILDKF